MKKKTTYTFCCTYRNVLGIIIGSYGRYTRVSDAIRGAKRYFKKNNIASISLLEIRETQSNKSILTLGNFDNVYNGINYSTNSESITFDNNKTFKFNY